MGIVFGKIDVEVPKHTVLEKKADYEIREYPPAVAAETQWESDNMWDRRGKETENPFRALARYIGVFSKPENQSATAAAAVAAAGAGEGSFSEAAGETKATEAIAMTAPVIMGEAKPEPVAMTAPVMMGEVKPEAVAMTAPVVMGEAGPAAEVSGAGLKKMMKMQFLLPSKYTMETAPRPTNPNVRLVEVPARTVAVTTFSGSMNVKLEETKAAQLKAALERDGVKIIGPKQYAGYNPPFTLPWLKTNEVFYPVERPTTPAST